MEFVKKKPKLKIITNYNEPLDQRPEGVTQLPAGVTQLPAGVTQLPEGVEEKISSLQKDLLMTDLPRVQEWKNKQKFQGIVYTHGIDTIRKVYKFATTDAATIVPKLKMEVYMQIKANAVSNALSNALSNTLSNEVSIEVVVPEIYHYGNMNVNGGSRDEQYFYIDMEHIAGQTMHDFVAENPNKCTVLDSIVGEIDSKLKDNSIHHNDLKSDNIIIKNIEYDGDTIIKLQISIIDFGDATESIQNRGAGGVNTPITLCQAPRTKMPLNGGTRKHKKKYTRKTAMSVRGKTKRHRKNKNKNKSKSKK
jgi:serine/threonine protein kinase